MCYLVSSNLLSLSTLKITEEEVDAEQPEPETEIRSRLAREVEVLRECLDWLQRLERGESVVVNLRPDADIETEFVGFDRAAGGLRAGTNCSRPG